MGQNNLTVKYLAPMWTTQLFRRVQLSTNTYVIHYTELVTNQCCQVLIGGLLHNYQVSANQCTIYALQYLYAASAQQVAQCKQKSRSLILSLIKNKCNHQLTYTVVAVFKMRFPKQPKISQLKCIQEIKICRLRYINCDQRLSWL